MMGTRSMFVDTPPLQAYAPNPFSAPTSPVSLSEMGDDTDFGPMGQDFEARKQGQAPSSASWFAHVGNAMDAVDDAGPGYAAAASAAGGRRRHRRSSGAVEKQIQYDPTSGKWTVVDVGHSIAHSDSDTDTASDSDTEAKGTALGGRLTQRFKDVSYPLFK